MLPPSVPKPNLFELIAIHVALFAHRAVRAFGNRVTPKRFFRAREYSNLLLRSYAGYFPGSVINVSGWNDTDREGGHYRDYFVAKTSYAVSNYATKERGTGSMDGTGVEEIMLDLNVPISKELEGKFDVVFNHTTLEHILHIETAFANLCRLSRDTVILVVPSMQNFHIVESYGDYWRMTPLAIAKLFQLNGFTPIVIRLNEQPFTPIYTLAIGVRDPKKYAAIIDLKIDLDFGALSFGSAAKSKYFEGLLSRPASPECDGLR